MSNHEEFPMMTPAARAAYEAAIDAIQNGKATISICDLRRALAAYQREAMRQSDPAAPGGRWGHLEAIAASLHNPPPPPPTLAEAREAARQLGGANAEVVHAFLATLGEAEQP